MTQEKLNLLQLPTCAVTEAGTRSSEIMRRELRHPQSVRVLLHYVPDDFLTYFRSPECALPTDAPEQFALLDESRR